MPAPDRPDAEARSLARTDELRRVLPPSPADPAHPRIARAIDDEYVRRAPARLDDRELRRYRRLTATAVDGVEGVGS